MACSNKDCPDLDKDPAPFNKLGECKVCHDRRMKGLSGSISTLPKLLVHWFGEAEKAHGKNCFYSSDVERLIDKKDNVKLAEIGLGDMGFGARIKIANNGAADSFLCTSKNFQLMTGINPSAAIKSFINGRMTICECEGMIKAVHFNALCDLIGSDVFDIAFADFLINGSGWGFEKVFFDEQKSPVSEDECDIGDWTFLAHKRESAVMFRELADKNKMGASASGWNLICASGGGIGKNTYFGFGLSGGRSDPMTLHGVKNSMIKECGGNPETIGWHLYLHFRRKLNVGNFLVWLEKELKLG